MRLAPISALALSALLACPAVAAPRFTLMNMALNSADQGKPSDARVEISIGPIGGGPDTAYLDIQGEEFLPYKVVQEAVPTAGAGFELNELKGQQIRIRITPGSSYATWSFAFDVVLHFDDGSQALVGSSAIRLSNSSPETVLPLSLAMVAHPTYFGGMKKLAFRLLSKDPGAADAQPSDAFASPGEVRGDPHAFTHMDFAVTTLGRAKDPATRVEVSIAPEGGGPPVAYLDIRNQALGPDSTSPEVVLPAGEGFTLDDLRHEQVLVKVTPSEGGRWTCKFDAILHFADGTQAMVGSGSFSSGAAGTSQAVPLSLASVARPGILGGIEKMTFKLVSKGAVTQTAAPAVPAPAHTHSASARVASAARAKPAPKHGARDFTDMSVKIRSGSKGRAADVGVEISIVPVDGGPTLADLTLEPKSIAANSSVMETVPATPWTSFTAADLKRLQLVVTIAAPGPATWIHSMDVTLHFADGTSAFWSTGDMTLSDYSSRETVSLADATLAKRGFFGGMEKAGFGLLNAIGK